MATEGLKKEDLAAELSSRTDEELKELLEKLYAEEEKISYKRRVLHGKIDILRAELVRRLKNKRKRGEKLFTRQDIEKLSEILARGATGVSKGSLEEEELF
jgi:FKBP-type peptidyl-prolyl cis-trans isomerase (trigger factor)